MRRDGSVVSFTCVYHSTHLILRIHCGQVINKGDSAFDFTSLLHTYVRVPEIGAVAISPLKGAVKLDQLQGKKAVVEERDPITIGGNVDAIYTAAPQSLVIDNVASSRAPTADDHSTKQTRRKLSLGKANLPDTGVCVCVCVCVCVRSGVCACVIGCVCVCV